MSNQVAEVSAKYLADAAKNDSWLAALKTRIHQAQQRATLAVNQELLLLYQQANAPCPAY